MTVIRGKSTNKAFQLIFILPSIRNVFNRLDPTQVWQRSHTGSVSSLAECNRGQCGDSPSQHDP